jgi:hypothetical protein
MALTKAQIAKLQADLKKTQADLKKAQAAAAKKPATPKPVAPTSGVIPGFKPEVAIPTPTKRPGDPGFVGPVVPEETAFIYNNVGLVEEVYTSGPKAGTSVATGGLVIQGSKPADTGAARTELFNELTAGSGVTARTTTGTVTKPNPLNTGGMTTTQVDSVAAIKALLSSYGIGDLGDAVANSVIKGYSEDTIDLIMQDPNSTDPLAVAFQKRFPANKARAAAGKSVISPGAYLALERQYTETMRSFGVAGLAKPETLSSFISNDVSASEVADRVGLAVTRIQNADPETKKALAEYYPMLSQTDIVTAFLDPKEGLPALQRKVTMAEIGGAGLVQGMKVAQTTAADLADYGVTQDEARKGYATIAELTPRADFLSQISAGPDYGQTEAEAEIFKGTASAKRARQSLTAIEQARFQGSAGTTKGSLGKSSQGAI